MCLTLHSMFLISQSYSQKKNENPKNQDVN